jgi:hypothetical protein
MVINLISDAVKDELGKPRAKTSIGKPAAATRTPIASVSGSDKILTDLPDITNKSIYDNPGSYAKSDLDDLPDQSSRLETLYYSARNISPDDAAASIRISKKTGKKPEFVAGNLSEFEKAEQAPESKYWDEIERDYPATADFLKQGANMYMAKDSTDDLSFYEKFYKEIDLGSRINAKRKIYNDTLGELRRTRSSGLDETAIKARVDGIYDSMIKLESEAPTEGWHIPYYAASVLPDTARSYLHGGVGGLAGAAGGAVVGGAIGSVVPGAGTATGARFGAQLGFRVGGVGGMLEYTYKQESNSAYGEYIRMKGPDGKAPKHQDIENIAKTVGAVNAIIETSTDVMMLNLAGKPLAAVGTKRLVPLVAKIPGGAKLLQVIGAKPEVFAKMTVSSAMIEAGKILLGTPLTETAEEVLQQGVGGAGYNVAAARIGIDGKPLQQIVDESLAVIPAAFQGTLPLGFLGGGANINNSFSTMRSLDSQADAAVSAYNKVGDVAKNSKFRKRSPEDHEAYISQVTKGTDKENTYIPADAFETYFQEKGINPADAAEELGVKDKYLEAKETGGDVIIPTATWITRTAATPHYEGLAEDVRPAIDQPTPREMREGSELIANTMIEEAKKAEGAVKGDEKLKGDIETAYRLTKEKFTKDKSIYSNMNKKQRDRLIDVNSRVTARLTVQAARARNMNIEQYVKERPITIIGEGSQRAIEEQIPSIGSQVRKIASNKAIYLPEDTRSDWSDVRAKNPGMFTHQQYNDKGVLNLSVDEAAAQLGMSEDELRDQMRQDLIRPDRQTDEEAAVEGQHLSDIQKEVVDKLGKFEDNQLDDILADDEKITAIAEALNLGEEETKTKEAVKKAINKIKRSRQGISGEPGVQGLSQIKPRQVIRRDIESPEVLFQEPTIAPAFFSKLQRTIEDKMPATAPIAQVRNIIKDMKADEIKWSGIENYLKGKDKINKEELLTFLKANELEIKEITKGGKGAGMNALQKRDYNALLIENRAFSDEMVKKYKREDYKGVMSEIDRGRMNEIQNRLEELENIDLGEATKFEKYTEPGGENYREVLFTLPVEEAPSKSEAIIALEKRRAIVRHRINEINNNPPFDMKALAKAEKEFDEIQGNIITLERTRIEGTAFRGSHFDEPNVFAHVRIDDRVDNKGKKVLFIEEIQSDWLQAGRKEGFRDVAREKAESDKLNELNNKLLRAKDSLGPDVGFTGRNGGLLFWDKTKPGQTARDFKMIGFITSDNTVNIEDIATEKQANTLNEIARLSKEINALAITQMDKRGVPDAPFQKTWHEFVLKRMIRYAAENGYDKIAWTTGQMQAARYDLSKQIESVRWSPDTELLVATDLKGEDVISRKVAREKLDDYVGKEVASRLLKSKARYEDGSYLLSGEEDLQVGGEGMKAFYDKIIPQFLNKFTKKYGAKVEQTGISTRVSDIFITEGQAKKALREGKDVMAQDSDGGEYAILSRDELEGAELVGDKFFLDEVGVEDVKVQSLEITPALETAALQEGFPLFQEKGERLGLARFTPAGPVIQLFKKADETTFIHELAHVWLKEFQEDISGGLITDAKFLNDWKILSKWLGIKEGQKSISRPQQEKFARGFELYVREGKSPSQELRSAFSSMRRWFTKIYRDVRKLNVEVPDEVKGVMDRMLASEDEILGAEQSAGIREIDLSGFSKESQDQIRALQSQAREESISILLKKQMDEIKTSRLTQIEKDKKKFDKVAREQVPQQQEYQAMKEIQKQFKKDPKVVSQKFIDKKLTEKQTVKYIALSEVHLYSSGDEMAKSIIVALPEDAAIEAASNAMLAAEHKNLIGSEAIKSEAIEAIHNDSQLELLNYEKLALQGILKASALPRARFMADAAKIRAKEMLAKKPLKEATAFLPYFTAERNAAQKVGQALARGDKIKAADYKQQQMLNHALAKEALRLKKKTAKWVASLKDMQTKARELLKRDEHAVQIANMLERFGLQREDHQQILDSVLSGKKRDNLPEEIDTLKEYIQKMNDQTSIIDIAEWLTVEGLRKDYRDLSVESLGDLNDALKNIQHVANFEKRTLAVMEGADFDEVVRSIVETLNTNIPEKDRHIPELDPVLERDNPMRQTIGSISYALTQPTTLFRKGDGYKDNGIMTQVFWDPTKKAVDTEIRYFQKIEKGLKKIWGRYSEDELTRMGSEKIFVKPLGTSVTKMRLLMFALNMGNDGNYSKMIGTPPVGLPVLNEWNEQVLTDALSENLTVKDWDVVQDIWDFINEFWPDIQEKYQKTIGFSPKKVENRPFTIPTVDGQVATLKGGYFPLKEDYRASYQAQQKDDAGLPLHEEQKPGIIISTKNGFSKQRTSAQYAVAGNMSILYRHLLDVAHDLSFRDAILDLRKIINDVRVQTALKTAFGDQGYLHIRKWISDAGGGGITVQRTMLEGVENLANVAKKNVTISALIGNVGVIMQNFANFTLYEGVAEGYGRKEAMHAFIVRGLGDFVPNALFNTKKAEQIRQFVYNKSAIMSQRRHNPDASIFETQLRMFGKKGINENTIQFMAGLIGYTDEMSSIPNWLEAYYKKIHEGAAEQAAIDYADTVVIRVLGTGGKYDLSPFIKSKGVLKLLAMFQGFFNIEMNRWMVEFGISKTTKNPMRFMGFAVGRIMMFNTLSLLLSGRWGQHEKDWDDKMKWWIKNMIGYPIIMVPIVRDLLGVALDGFLGIRGWGYQITPVESIGKSVERFAQATHGAFFTKKKGRGQKLGEATTRMFSYGINPWGIAYPTMINNVFWNAYDLSINGKAPTLDVLWGRRIPRR